MVCLGKGQRSFCLFWDCTQVLHFRVFVDYEGYSISSKGFLPIVVDKIFIWIKFALSVHFSSLIPKMLMFILAISCLTISNFPWLMDLIHHWRRKQTELYPVLGQAANIRLHAWSPSQWTLNFVPSAYRNGIPMGNQTPRIKELQNLYLDSPLPKRIC